MTKRRYSHLGPVCVHKGIALGRATIKTLYRANRHGVTWSAIARRCGIGRATLYRVLCGGNARRDTVDVLERFAGMWRTFDDKAISSMMARKRRAA